MKAKPLLVIFLTVFIDLVGFGMIIPLSPFLAREYGADPFWVGLLMTIYSLMQFLMAPFWGALSDRIGRRPVILVSLVGAGLAHLMFGFSSTLALLFVARGLAGLFGANIATAMAYIADITDEKNRSKGMGMVGAAFGLGFVMGPFIGGVASHIGLQIGDSAPFGESFAALVAAVICIGNAVLAYFVLPETLDKENIKYSQKKTKRLKRMLGYIGKPGVGPLLIAFFFSTFGLANIEAPMFLFVQDHFDWTLMQASFGFAYIGLIMVFTQGYLIRKVIPKMGERNAMALGLSLFALGLFGVALSTSLWDFAFAVTLLGLGSGISNPSITGSISLMTPKDEQGAVLGVNQSLSALGRILGPALGGWLYREINSGASFVSGGVMVGFALLLVIIVRSQLPQAGQQKESSAHG